MLGLGPRVLILSKNRGEFKTKKLFFLKFKVKKKHLLLNAERNQNHFHFSPAKKMVLEMRKRPPKEKEVCENFCIFFGR